MHAHTSNTHTHTCTHTHTHAHNKQGWYDNKPAWQFVDDRPRIEHLTAGGWRTFHAMAQAFADGVVDEFRPVGDGA